MRPAAAPRRVLRAACGADEWSLRRLTQRAARIGQRATCSILVARSATPALRMSTARRVAARN
jgi:hypothetical protein